MTLGVGIFVFLMGSSAVAAKTEMTLFVSNHQGFRKQEVITLESPKKIAYNGVEISKRTLPKVQKALAALQKMPQEKKKFCYANQYIYTLSVGTKKQEIHACAEGKEFARIAGAFFEVRQALLKKRK